MIAIEFPLTTERLSLRPFTERDFDAVYDLQSRPDVVRYLPYGVRTEPEVRASLAEKIKSSSWTGEAGVDLSLAVELRETGQVIGDVLLFNRSKLHRLGEIGYVFHPDHAGRGYATEAGRELLRLGFEEFGLYRIIGRLDARNTASAAVMERLGMRREAHFVRNEIWKGEWTDELVYAILDEEWAAQTPPGGGLP